NKNSFLPFLTYCCCAIIIADIVRVYSKTWAKTTEKIFQHIMKPQEKRGKLSGASYMFLGFVVSGYCFEQKLAITSWLVLIISDALAAIGGVAFSTLRNKSTHGICKRKNKTFMGSSIFFLSSVVIGYINFGVANISCYTFASCSSVIVEYYAKQINLDDNFSIPICYCCGFVMLSAI
ncbi:diacylglycerol/polyprenol kinase family protein, partial [Candidatus Sarmatiella mevalonica]|uniref:hypothetical protein n=1 Tax=Candidatus Sarmatiella mevalonica TaxID=2770581 RepID=UPI001A918316